MTEEQFEFLKKIAEKSEQTSEYGCQPIMEVIKEEITFGGEDRILL